MTAKTPPDDDAAPRPEAPATEGPQADFIGDNLRKLFDDVAGEAMPDQLSSLLARLAEEDARQSGGADGVADAGEEDGA